MLSRVAESLYWMSRYVERAERLMEDYVQVTGEPLPSQAAAEETRRPDAGQAVASGL